MRHLNILSQTLNLNDLNSVNFLAINGRNYKLPITVIFTMLYWNTGRDTKFSLGLSHRALLQTITEIDTMGQLFDFISNIIFNSASNCSQMDTSSLSSRLNETYILICNQQFHSRHTRRYFHKRQIEFVLIFFIDRQTRLQKWGLNMTNFSSTLFLSAVGYYTKVSL